MSDTPMIRIAGAGPSGLAAAITLARAGRTVEVHDRAGNVVGSKDVVLYAGLLSQAHEEGLTRVRTSILQIPTEENGRLAIVKADDQRQLKLPPDDN